MEITEDLPFQLTIDSNESELAATTHIIGIVVNLEDTVVSNITYNFTIEYQLSLEWIAEEECKEILDMASDLED